MAAWSSSGETWSEALARAGAEDRMGFAELAQGLQQVFQLDQLEHGAALAAGDDERIDILQSIRRTHFDGFGPGALQGFRVGLPVASLIP
jgi:hypothetical protein